MSANEGDVIVKIIDDPLQIADKNQWITSVCGIYVREITGKQQVAHNQYFNFWEVN